MHLIDGHRICVAKYENKFKPVETNKTSGKKEAWIQQETDMKKEETVAESGRIFIRNLSYTVTEEELEALFKPFGPLAEIHLPIDKHSRRIKDLRSRFSVEKCEHSILINRRGLLLQRLYCRSTL